ncbi:hypothetical protein [Bacillus sp. MRMR6]|uniref:hypothetical protein n=1 Tax=Bacillus sp. MRMR6 TaxID=1928617 RepID=UPI000950EC5F|nr:hypothetical protein [Bacillus sp. MRMR6]OLS37837.1 hypothetical protein BTR25_15090 [Bacillus sp. MRMR6]
MAAFFITFYGTNKYQIKYPILKLENGKWYFYKGGVRQTGWILDSNKWYFLDKNGVMQTGWI